MFRIQARNSACSSGLAASQARENSSTVAFNGQQLLEQEEKAPRGNPCDQQKRAGGHSEHDQGAEVVIVWLAAQRSAFLHVDDGILGQSIVNHSRRIVLTYRRSFCTRICAVKALLLPFFLIPLIAFGEDSNHWNAASSPSLEELAAYPEKLKDILAAD